MNNLEKIKLLNEVILKTKPERVDYSSGKYYSIELVAFQPVTISMESHRLFTIKGYFEKDTIVMTLVVKSQEIFTLRNVPCIEWEGDRTPIYKIIYASVLFAKATIKIPTLHRAIKKIDTNDYPLVPVDKAEQIKRETKFMTKIASIMRDKENEIRAKVHQSQPASLGIKWFCEKKDKEKINASYEILKKFIPTKGHIKDTAPDVYIWDELSYAPKEKIDQQIIVLSTKYESKEQFWWNYLKLNICLHDPEYKYGYFLLMGRWREASVQKWIAEYKEKGFFESPRAKERIVFYLKAGEKTTARILNSFGSSAKFQLNQRY